MKKEDKAILIAMCIGDGSLEKTSNLAVRLKIEHSLKQQEYTEWKLNKLSSIVGGKRPIMAFTNRIRAGSQLHSCMFRKHHRYFRVLRKWLYPKGEKTLTRNVLNKLTPEGLAIWFMDDGSTENTSKNSFRIALCCDTTHEQCELIQQYFKEIYDIQWNINKNNKGICRLRCSTIQARKLFDIISPYIITSMRYKLQVPYHLWHECRTPAMGEDIV
jgi:hypothetical protein